MTEPTVTHATFVIERSYPAAPGKVFAAFADPAKKRRWYAGDRGPMLEDQQSDFRVGGHDRTRFRMGDDTPLPGEAIVNDTVYQDIVPDRRIVFAYTMSMKGRPFSASLSTVELLASGQGTRLVFTEQAAFFEGSDGPTMREEGWSGLLDNLGRALAA
jgi:uncharacterized protein YndB with AHSA1/START domain